MGEHITNERKARVGGGMLKTLDIQRTSVGMLHPSHDVFDAVSSCVFWLALAPAHLSADEHNEDVKANKATYYV